MKLKVFTNKQLDIKQTAKLYSNFYGKIALKHLEKVVDRIDDIIVNH